MDAVKLQMKVGPHEFSIECADGDYKYANEKVGEFQKMVMAYAAICQEQPTASLYTAETARVGSLQERVRICNEIPKSRYEQFFDTTDGAISAPISPECWTLMRPETVVLVLMLGHFALTNAAHVPAPLLRQSLEKSGGDCERIDRIIQPAIIDEFVGVQGTKKGTRYSLTIPGMQEAIRTFHFMENTPRQQAGNNSDAILLKPR